MLIRCDGFDTYGNNAESSNVTSLLSSGYYADFPGSNPIMCDFTSATRTGVGLAMAIAANHGGHMAFDAAGDIIFGFAYYNNSLHNRSICYGSFDNYIGSVIQKFRLRAAATGVLVCQFGAGPGVVYSPVNSIFAATWHYIEGRIKLSSGSDGVIEIRVDGNTVINYTGPTSAGADQMNMFGWIAQDAFTSYMGIDDFYILKKDGVGLTDFLGDCIVRALTPVDDAGPNDWEKTGGAVSHASAVAENPRSDEDASYLRSNTHGDAEYFGISAIPDATVDILAVQVNARVRKDGAGVSKYKIGLRSDATTAYSPNKAPAVAYTTQFFVAEHDPNGGGAWTKASVEAAKIGIEIV